MLSSADCKSCNTTCIHDLNTPVMMLFLKHIQTNQINNKEGEKTKELNHMQFRLRNVCFTG